MARILFFGVVIILCWFGFQFAAAFYEEVQIKDIVMSVIIENRTNPSNQAMVYDIRDRIKKLGTIQISAKDIDVDWSVDRKNIVVKLKYTKTIQIPLINKTWTMIFTPEIKPAPLSF